MLVLLAVALGGGSRSASAFCARLGTRDCITVGRHRSRWQPGSCRSQRQNKIKAVPCSHGPNELGYRRNKAPPAEVKCVPIRRWFAALQANTASVALALALLVCCFPSAGAQLLCLIAVRLAAAATCYHWLLLPFRLRRVSCANRLWALPPWLLTESFKRPDRLSL